MVFVNTMQGWGGGEAWTLQTAIEMHGRGHGVELIPGRDSILHRRACRAGLSSHALPLTLAGRISTLPVLYGHFLSRGRPRLWIANGLGDVWLSNTLRLPGMKDRLLYRRGLDRPIRTNPLLRARLRRADCILANSRATRATVVSSLSWFPADRIEVVYNTLDPKVLARQPDRDIRAEYGVSARAYVIGAVGRLERQKGQDLLLEAFARLHEQMPDSRLLIVGCGPLRSSLEAQARRLGIEDSTIFTGFVEQVLPYYLACDVVAVPSRFEGFCYAALEAQLLAKPVVGFNVSSLPELIQDNEGGFLVPAEDVGGMALRLLELGNDGKLCRAMGRRGSFAASRRFPPQSIFDRLERLFREVVAGPSVMSSRPGEADSGVTVR